jgi:hypothetical protein
VECWRLVNSGGRPNDRLLAPATDVDGKHCKNKCDQIADGWAQIALDIVVVDRHRFDLAQDGYWKLPHHQDASWKNMRFRLRTEQSQIFGGHTYPEYLSHFSIDADYQLGSLKYLRKSVPDSIQYISYLQTKIVDRPAQQSEPKCDLRRGSNHCLFTILKTIVRCSRT